MSGGGGGGGGGGHYGRSAPDQHLRKLERDAYCAVLRAFTAQSEVITWVRSHSFPNWNLLCCII